MKRLIVAGVVAAATIAVGSGTASADACHGEIVGDIASTWPFAHEGMEDFTPPPGALALWNQLFTPFDNPGELNRDIQAFCSGAG